MPELVADAGLGDRYDEAIAGPRSCTVRCADFPDQASYVVALAHRIRYVMPFDVREAMHLIELRSGVQGHPAYRRVAQQMHRAIAEVAGHGALAEAMTFVDHGATDLDASNPSAGPSAGGRKNLQRIDQELPPFSLVRTPFHS